MENDTQNVPGSMELCDIGMGLEVRGTGDLRVRVFGSREYRIWKILPCGDSGQSVRVDRSEGCRVSLGPGEKTLLADMI